MEKRNIGDHVVFVDPVGIPHDALVTEVWGPDCVNVLYVSQDPNRSDSFGRQLERSTPVMHGRIQQAHGNYWRLVSDEPKSTEVNRPAARPSVKHLLLEPMRDRKRSRPAISDILAHASRVSKV